MGLAKDTEKASQARSEERAAVTLVNGSHRWTFACTQGDEAALLRRIAELAQGADVPLDQFDAAFVGHQLQNRLKPGLERNDGQISPGSV